MFTARYGLDIYIKFKQTVDPKVQSGASGLPLRSTDNYSYNHNHSRICKCGRHMRSKLTVTVTVLPKVLVTWRGNHKAKPIAALTLSSENVTCWYEPRNCAVPAVASLRGTERQQQQNSGTAHESSFIKKNPTRYNNVSTFFYFIFIWSSTCFGRHTPIIRSLKLHWQPWFCIRGGLLDVWLLDAVRLCLTASSNHTCRPKHIELHINM